jgi:peptidoglycan hydrolase-like protein with peptidoglycan-binding domain
MSREGVDYAWHGSIDTDRLRAASVTFAMRYLSNDDTKNLHRAEAVQLGRAGIDVGVVWETTPRRPLSGRAGGIADAGKAAAQANLCGMPSGRPIYFAVDYDAGDADKPTIAEYLRGAASVLGGVQQVGVYGGYWVVKYCLDHGAAAYGWQTLAWSGGHRDERAQLYQHTVNVHIGELACDLNTAFASDFGQWRPAGGATPAPPFPFPPNHYLATARNDPACHTRGGAVTAWQRKMAQRGWVIPTSGTFDARCDEVCRRFQDEKGLVVDGKVGPITWKATWTAPVTRGEPGWPEEPEPEWPEGSEELPWDGDDDRRPLL